MHGGSNCLLHQAVNMLFKAVKLGILIRESKSISWHHAAYRHLSFIYSPRFHRQSDEHRCWCCCCICTNKRLSYWITSVGVAVQCTRQDSFILWRACHTLIFTSVWCYSLFERQAPIPGLSLENESHSNAAEDDAQVLTPAANAGLGFCCLSRCCGCYGYVTALVYMWNSKASLAGLSCEMLLISIFHQHLRYTQISSLERCDTFLPKRLDVSSAASHRHTELGQCSKCKPACPPPLLHPLRSVLTLS